MLCDGFGVGLTAGVAALLLPRAAEASNDSKVTICHRGVPIEVDASALQGHTAHGDQPSSNSRCCDAGKVCNGSVCCDPGDSTCFA